MEKYPIPTKCISDFHTFDVLTIPELPKDASFA